MNWRRVGLAGLAGGIAGLVRKRRQAEAGPSGLESPSQPSTVKPSVPTGAVDPLPSTTQPDSTAAIVNSPQAGVEPAVAEPVAGLPAAELPLAELPTTSLAVPDLPTANLGGQSLDAPELAVPELAVPELALPELAVSEPAVPELALPELAVPELAVPEAVVPELAVPEPAVPEFPVPELPVPNLDDTETSVPSLVIPTASSAPDIIIPSHTDTAPPEVSAEPTVAPIQDVSIGKPAPQVDPLVVQIPSSDDPDNIVSPAAIPQTPTVAPLVAPAAVSPTTPDAAMPTFTAPVTTPQGPADTNRAAPSDDDKGWRPSRGWSAFGSFILLLLVAGVIAASFVRLPYYRFAPGSVYGTIERVDAPGDLVIFPDEGNIGFVTVSQTADISVWQWLDAKLDSNIRLEHEDEVEGDQTAEEQREQDRRRMQVSKDDAVVVALQRLGFDLVITPLGVEVAQVFDCTAADGTLGTGDLIVGVNGVPVTQTEELVGELLEIGIGQDVELLVERIDPSNPTQSISTELVGLTLGSADDACLSDEIRAEEPRPFIGISTANIFDEDLPIEVDIETGRVGGPSAGLAFTLAIIDVLSEGELTNGLDVVVTGVIGRNGEIGPVGGIQQKTIAAARSGADLFIVPRCCENFVDPETGEPVDLLSNYEEALLYAGDDMMVVGVDTLDDALRALGELGGEVDDFIVE